jgi:hypothetical protein
MLFICVALFQGIYLDIYEGGMDFDTMGVGSFPMYAPVIMLCIDIALYFVLAVYLDLVIPGQVLKLLLLHVST